MADNKPKVIYRTRVELVAVAFEPNPYSNNRYNKSVDNHFQFGLPIYNTTTKNNLA